MNIAETTFYEKINIYKLDYILKNQSKYEEIIKEQEKDMRRTDKHYNAYAVFQKIKENVFIPPEYKDTEFGLIKINYKKGKNSNNIGRWYANYGIGIQPLCCSVRHTICYDIWVDIDQVNSHPTILKHVMDKYDLKSPLLDEYLNHREEFLKKVIKDEKCSRDTAKTYVIAVINGAKYASSTLKKLYEELKPIINHVINLPEYKDILDFVKITYNSNIEGKAISRILQIIENQLLELYLDFFNSKGLIEKYNKNGYITSLMFDGFQLLKNDAINDDLLKECRKYALDKTGYDIELKIKPFDNCLELPDDYKSTFNINDYKIICEKDEIIKNDDDENLIDSADDDEGAANIVVKYYKDKLLICEKNLYVYNNHIWNGDEKEVNKLLCNMITNLKIKFVGADNKRKYSYSSSVKHQKNCIIAIKNNSNIKINDNFINDLSFNNKYYIPFLNGVYSFKDKKIYEYEALSNIYFTHIINRDFMPKDDEAYNELMTQVINPIYPIESEKKYNAEIKARAIAGCVQDKMYYLQTGERNSGKGVETDLMKKAFDKYVKSFDTSSLIYNKFKVNDAKALSWLVDKRFARILIGNEIDTFDDDDENKRKKEPILMNSKLIKQLVSGGDEIEARQNYKDEIQFKVGFTVFINSNDTFEFTTKDAGGLFWL